MSQKVTVTIFRKFEFGDKNFNIQFENLTEEMKESIYRFVRTEEIFDPVKAFFQGDSGDWLMIEFWSGPPSIKRLAVKDLLSHIGMDNIQSDDLHKLDDMGE